MIVALAALATALAMAALGVSVYALFNAQKLCHGARKTMESVREECAAAIGAAETKYAAIASELQTAKLQAPPPVEVSAGTARPSMNVTKRSQALRLHRKGDSSEQIAAALQVPRQEIDLLIKVHQIVLNNL
jgi:DNA-binding NarL/FixJ family response regulator